MDYKISGSGTVCPGEYSAISISGSAKVTGKILCETFHVSGAAKADGDIECLKDMKVSGAFKTTHNIKTCDLSVSGSCHTDGNVNAIGNVKISGSARIDGGLKAAKIRISGGVNIGTDIEAEQFEASGNVKCPGLLNAQSVDIRTGGSGIQIGQIGGGTIVIAKERHGGADILRLPLFQKLMQNSSVGNRVELIEGDNIAVEACHVGKIVGANVAIGEGADVDRIEYSESIEIHEKAKVGEYVKV